MSYEAMTALMVACLIIGIMIGIPIAFTLGGSALIIAYFLWGPQSLHIAASGVFNLQTALLLPSIPLFIFMGAVLQDSGIAERLYRAMHKWFGPLRGGLAMGTVIVCTMFAAMSGSSATGTLAMGVIALPNMLRRGYKKDIAIGCIAGGGALGILIPPSIPMILYGFMTGVSVGKLFMGGLIPGVILSALFIIYIALRCWRQPEMAPALPREERGTARDKLLELNALILPALVVFAVLGSMFFGIASPSEAAAVGAFGALVCAAIGRKFGWGLMKTSTMTTMKLTSLALWITVGAKFYATTYTALGGQQFVAEALEGLGVNRWVIIIGIQFIFFLLGAMLDPIGIIMLTVPIFVPVVTSLGFDPVWFGIVFTVNMEMSYLTPPFGWNLFYLKAVAPEGVTMGDIIRSVLPFLGIQALCLGIVLAVPSLSLWLPSKMF